MFRRIYWTRRSATFFVDPIFIIGIVLIVATAYLLDDKRPTNLIVLLEDPQGKTGAVDVITETGRQSLTESGAATGVSGAGEAPRTPFSVSETEIDKLFGAAIKARPILPASFTLYFQPNSSNLTDPAKAEIANIISEIKRRKVSEISIFGHADRTGSATVNIRVSLQRARVVRDALDAAGLRGTSYTIDSFGDRDPLVPTPPGVAEPRNRRVEVIVR